LNSVKYKLTKKDRTVKKILAIRLQATGDVMIAMPYLYDLRNKLEKGIKLDLLVREEAEHIPRSFTFFDSIITLKGGRNTKLQLLHFLWLYPKLYLKGYDVILDLQNLKITRVIRKLLGVKTWTEFDRNSPIYAGDRYKNTINVLNLTPVDFLKLDQLKKIDAEALLKKFGLKKDEFYIVINPAGAFENRNWALDNYVAFCKLWTQNINADAKFLILGIEKIKEKAVYLQEKIGSHAINLVCKTSQEELLHILQYAKLTVSDDSGLLHMSYCLGIPSIGILGSTRNDWTNPNLPHTMFFNSSDLECGNCMLEHCKFSEIKCLTRVKPEHVLNAATNLLKIPKINL
jgi:heptosyltransferase-2